MTYGVEALPLLREEVEDCPATKAKLVLIDEFCELNDKNYNFVCYVKLYFTTEEIIVARRKIWKAQAPAFTFSRVHKIKDIVFKKEAYLTDIVAVEDFSKEQKFYYQIHFSGDLKEWFTAFERFSQWHQNKQQAVASAAAVNNCNEVKLRNGGQRGTRVSSMVLWNRADCQFLNATVRNNSVSSSQDLSSHLVTPVRSNRLSNCFYKDTALSGEEDVSSSPEPQEPSGIDLDSISISEEGDTSREEVEKTFSTALEAWTPSSNDYTTASSLSNEVPVIPKDDQIRTLDTAVCNKGHSRNKSTSLTRGVQIVSRSDSSVSSAASDPGANPSQCGLAYANIPAVLRSISYDYRSNSFLSSPLRHTQIRGKKVKFSPRQKTFSAIPRDDGSEECLIFENDTPESSFCSITPDNSVQPEDLTATLRPLTPTRSVPTTKQERGASLASQGSTFTLPKRKLVAKLFRRRTASSISDIDDSSHMDMETPETQKLMKKKLYQMDPKLLASQLVLLDAEMLRKIKPEELKGGAWVGKNKETRAPNVMQMVQEFNRLALLVPTEVLDEKTASARAKVIACYIQIAEKCRSLGNYNSLKAILAGLQCTPIYRLKKTWKEVSGRRKKKFEDLSHLMSEEDNWKVYKSELYDVMSKGTCVPFLGQFLTQIMQQETAKEVISYRKKSHGRRPQSGDLNSDNRETLSAPTTPVNSDHEDILDSSLVVSPTDLNIHFDQTTPTLSNLQPDELSEETKTKESELEGKPNQEDGGIKKDPSGISVVERRDMLSPLPVRKFKRSHLVPTNLCLKKYSINQSLHKSECENKDTIGEGDKIVEDGDTAGHKLEAARCEVVKTISMESLDSYDGASSCYSRGSTPARDVVTHVQDGEIEGIQLNDATVLDVSQVELNIEDSLDTPTSDFDKEGSPYIDPFASTPTEDIETVNTSNEDNGVEEPTANVEKSPMKYGKKKRRWNSFRKKLTPSEGNGHNVTNCNEDSTCKKESRELRRNLSSPIKSFSSSSCNENSTLKKDKGRKQSSPSRDGSPSCNDDIPSRKVKRSFRRKLSSPLRSHHSSEDPPTRRDKLHIYHHRDVDSGFNAHAMLQQMQFSSMRYMNSLDARPEIQSYIKGLQYNSEEDNYHMSIQMEPIEQNY